MRFNTIPIIVAALAATALQVTKLPAQPAEEKRVRVAACSLLETSPPPLFYRNEKGDYERFFVPERNRNRYHVLPETSQLQLYREGKTPEGATVYQPSIALNLIPGADHQLFLLHHKPSKGYGVRAINSDAAAHPGGTIRLLNLLERPVAVQIDNQRFEIAPGQSQDLKPEVNGSVEKRFLFTYAFQRDRTRPYVSPTKRIRLRNQDSRLLIVFSQGFQELQDSSEQEVQLIAKPEAVQLYDTAPPKLER